MGREGEDLTEEQEFRFHVFNTSGKDTDLDSDGMGWGWGRSSLSQGALKARS